MWNVRTFIHAVVEIARNRLRYHVLTGKQCVSIGYRKCIISFLRKRLTSATRINTYNIIHVDVYFCRRIAHTDDKTKTAGARSSAIIYFVCLVFFFCSKINYHIIADIINTRGRRARRVGVLRPIFNMISVAGVRMPRESYEKYAHYEARGRPRLSSPRERTTRSLLTRAAWETRYEYTHCFQANRDHIIRRIDALHVYVVFAGIFEGRV